MAQGNILACEVAEAVAQVDAQAVKSVGAAHVDVEMSVAIQVGHADMSGPATVGDGVQGHWNP